MTDTPAYGTEDATFQAAGGESGIRRLVDAFYDVKTIASQTFGACIPRI